MALIRRFEEEAGRQYQQAKAGGFLHLAIGEEATIVGTTSVMRPEDYLIGTYRTHGHAIARGTDPKSVMAELFGREDGCSRGRGGSMHIFDRERRFMGGYGIVGGNLPIAAGLALASDYKGSDVGHRVHVRRRRLEHRQLRRDDEPGGALEAAGRLPGREQPLRHGHVDRAPLGGHRPLAKGRGAGRARGPRRRHGRARDARDGRRAHPHRARGAPADPGRGVHLPLPRPLRRRPRGLPDQGGGRGMAQEGPGQGLPRPPARRGRDLRGRPRGAAGADRAAGHGRGRVRRQLARAAARVAVRPPLRGRRPGAGLVRGRRAHPGAAPRRGGARGGRQGRGPQAGRGGRRLCRAAEPQGAQARAARRPSATPADALEDRDEAEALERGEGRSPWR